MSEQDMEAELEQIHAACARRRARRRHLDEPGLASSAHREARSHERTRIDRDDVPSRARRGGAAPSRSAASGPRPRPRAVGHEEHVEPAAAGVPPHLEVADRAAVPRARGTAHIGAGERSSIASRVNVSSSQKRLTSGSACHATSSSTSRSSTGRSVVRSPRTGIALSKPPRRKHAHFCAIVTHAQRVSRRRTTTHAQRRLSFALRICGKFSLWRTQEGCERGCNGGEHPRS